MHVLVMFEENKNKRMHDIVDKEKKECTIKKGHDKIAWHMTLARCQKECTVRGQRRVVLSYHMIHFILHHSCSNFLIRPYHTNA